MKQDSKSRKAFKDWFDRDAAKALARQVASSHPDFDQQAFVRRATNGLGQLEFHDRVRLFSSALAAELPPVPDALDILVRSLPAPLATCEAITDGWLQWPIGHFIGKYGLNDYKRSMRAMQELTMRFSAEFPIRAFIAKYPQRAMKDLLKLTSHRNPHVRRWCSEGCRPRLPWGQHLQELIADPTPIWPILERLKDDPELYVRRSVANNLNDIAKDHPQAVIQRCHVWMKQKTPEHAWVVRHGLRTLIKQGDSAALKVLGYSKPDQISGSLQLRPASIRIGESVEMKVSLSNQGQKMQPLIVDYAVHYVRKNRKGSVKVFKWKALDLSAGEQVHLTKHHSMSKTSVRSLYPGTHHIELQVNGIKLAQQKFQLMDSAVA